MNTMKKATYFLILSVLVLTSCAGEFNKVYKSTDMAYRYEYAKQSFAEGKFARAASLLMDLITQKKGHDDAEEALYIGDRRKVASLLRAGKKADYADKDVERILRSWIAPAPEKDGEGEREVHVVGGDYFSQAQYKGVGRTDDNIFTRFAVKIKSDGVKDDKTGFDIADRYATETLAEIFAEQGCVEEARRIYSRLILDNPEKSAYFAALIDKLK